ncbi:MAG: hypothetical protein ACRD3V_34445 [Vicinamibacteria bacterium]
MGIMLWLLTTLFAVRVLGQALQKWVPQPYLPPFDAFQGSNLPYSVLLSSQLAILALMGYLSSRVQAGMLRPSRRTGTVLRWAGALYMLAALGRIAIGVLVPDAPPWFRAWISACFHVVLASFVLLVSVDHLRPSRLG